MSVDTIGDFLTIVRNGIKASRPWVKAPYSKVKHQIGTILKDEGFVRDVIVEDEDSFRTIKVILKYVNGESVVHSVKRASTPGRRLYHGYRTFQPVIGGLGISIITTSQGIMTDKKARERSLGGEVICSVW